MQMTIKKILMTLAITVITMIWPLSASAGPPIHFKYRFEAPAGSFGGAETTEKNGFADLGDGFEENGAQIRATDTIDVTINWDGKKESFSLRCRS